MVCVLRVFRMYCSRRLRRIRKSLHFVQGHRNRFNKKPVTIEKVTDARWVWCRCSKIEEGGEGIDLEKHEVLKERLVLTKW